LRRSFVAVAGLTAAALALTACATTGASSDAGENANQAERAPTPPPRGMDPGRDPAAFPSTYRPLPSQTTAIVNANILTATGQEIRDGVLVMADGKIAAVGPQGTAVPSGARVIDAAGRWVTPGIIDIHSHLGVYPSPGVQGMADGNEATNPNTARVWAEHSIWPQDPGFNTARAGGVTSLAILPGSANLFGGRTVTLKNVPSRTVQGMKFPDAPHGLKMACGENPSRVYGSRNQTPSTGMANIAGFRAAWIDAADYARKWDDYRRKVEEGDEKAAPPKRDLQLDTLAGVLRGEILIQNHCYRADEMAQMIDIADEFGFEILTFHHATEAYKIADVLAREGICSAIWGSGWWGFKMESLDGIEENAALLEKAGACAVVHSDDAELIQRLNQEAAMAMSAGRRMGVEVSRAEAIKWITLNAAKGLGIEGRTGSLEPGKMADVVLWSADPFSVYAKADQVFIDGALVYDRADPRFQPKSDFELGFPTQERAR
jgi:imidazolonepropionase-like amidohydrolase